VQALELAQEATKQHQAAEGARRAASDAALHAEIQALTAAAQTAAAQREAADAAAALVASRAREEVTRAGEALQQRDAALQAAAADLGAAKAALADRGGELAATRRLMPLVGRERSGVWFATGFGGHGLNTTVMAGELIAGAIASDGQDTRYRQLQDRYAPGWEGGPFKTVAAGLMIKLFELQDWWRVRCWNS